MASHGEVNIFSGEDINGPLAGRRSDLKTYTLTILIKSLELNERRVSSEDERFMLLLTCDKSSVNASGTLASLNAEKLGNVIDFRYNVEMFMRFLNGSSIEVTLNRDNSTIGKGQLRLQDTAVVNFDPQRETSQAAMEEFPLYDGSKVPIGVVTMVLHAEQNTPPAVSAQSSQLNTADIMYVVNEDRRRASDQQDALQRQLLVCHKCNVLRSPDDFSCQYELVDGILHHKTVGSTEKEIERIKQKLRDVALDETIGHRDSVSVIGDAPSGKICGLCRGLTISGVTCGEHVTHGIKPSSGRVGHECQIPCKDATTTPKHVNGTTPKLVNRCCERCKTCLNWLPEACRCPKCGHKTQQAKRGEQYVKRSHLLPHSHSDVGVTSNKSSSPMLSGSNTMVASTHSCPICTIRQCRCIDCARRVQHSDQCTSCSDIPEVLYPRSGTTARPITRRSSNGAAGRQRERKGESLPGVGPSVRRSDQLRQAYAARQDCATGRQDGGGKHCLTGAQIRKNRNSFLRKVKQHNRNVYSYRFGRRHRGLVVGHKTCMKHEQLVPAHMGWRWNTCTVGIGKRRPGWRPGAVRKPIVRLMQHFLKCYPTDNLPVTRRLTGHGQPPSSRCHEDGPGHGPKPTLHITKQHGEYTITMNPLKDAQTLKGTTDAYLPCEPIKFRLCKDPRLTKLYQLRDNLQAKGITMCGCRELAACEHRSEREKRVLVEEVRRAAKRVGLPADTTFADLPSRNESELNVAFTPMSAIIRPDVKRPDVVVAETQYCEEDYRIRAVPTVEKRPDRKQATGSGKVASSSARKPPAGRTANGKGDGAARAPVAGAKQPPATSVPRGTKTLPKGGDTAKKGAPARPEVKSTGDRVATAKAKGATKK